MMTSSEVIFLWLSVSGLSARCDYLAMQTDMMYDSKDAEASRIFDMIETKRKSLFRRLCRLSRRLQKELRHRNDVRAEYHPEFGHLVRVVEV